MEQGGDITTYLEQLVFWHWMVAGMALVILEMLAPGFIFMWLGMAAGVTGLTLLTWPNMAWETQFLTFAILAIFSVFSGRIWMRRAATQTDHPTLNRRGEQYVGRQFTLEEPIVNGRGKLSVDDTTWKIGGEDMPAGATVRVTGVDGVILTVEKA